MAATLAHDDKEFPTFAKMMESQTQDSQAIKDFYSFIKAAPGGQERLVALYAAPYQHSVSGNGAVLNLWFYTHVYVDYPDLKKRSTLNTGGFSIGFPASSADGTLQYNDINDLQGDCDVVYGTLPLFTGISFQRNGQEFARFLCASFGSIAGIQGGRASWS